MKKYLLPLIVLFVITTSLCKAQNPTLWGMTNEGGINGIGTLFNYNCITGTETDKHDFAGSPNDGRYSIGSLIKANNGLLYGMTYEGGANNAGTILSYNISTGIETNLHNFGSGTDGADPRGSLIQASDSLLYGLTWLGGSYNRGIIFSYNIYTDNYSIIHNFGSGTDGAAPGGSLIQASNGLLYGVVSGGGTYGGGIIFSYNSSSNNYSVLYSFGSGTDGQSPNGSLIQGNDSLLYGMTQIGGTNHTSPPGDGTIFSYNISTGIETVLHDFDSSDGEWPVYGRLLQVDDSLLHGLTQIGGLTT